MNLADKRPNPFRDSKTIQELLRFEDRLKISEKVIMRYKAIRDLFGENNRLECPYKAFILENTNIKDFFDRDKNDYIQPYALNGKQDSLHDFSKAEIIIDEPPYNSANGIVLRCKYCLDYIGLEGCYYESFATSWMTNGITIKYYRLIHGRFCRKTYCQFSLYYKDKTDDNLAVFYKGGRTIFTINQEVWDCYLNWRHWEDKGEHKCSRRYCYLRKWLTGSGIKKEK